MSFSNNLKSLIIDEHITQNKLAQKIGYTQRAVSKWVNGQAEPTESAIVKCAKYFEVSTDYLLGLTSDDGAKLYSAPTASTMGDVHSSKELQLLEIYRNLSPDMQATLWSLLETWNPSTHKNKV